MRQKEEKLRRTLKRNKRRMNRMNAIGGAGVAIGNKPFTTDSIGHPIIIKTLNAK